MKETSRLEFRDKAIDKIKYSDLEFSYIKDGIIKYRKVIYIPFVVGKKSSLKGLKLCIYKNSQSKYFDLQFWFNRRSYRFNIGKFVPGIFGTKQCDEKLHQLVKDHTDDNGYWIKNPLLTERNKTRVITKANVKTLERKTINETIIEFYKSEFPRATRSGNLRARSMKDHSLYLIGHNWRVKHMSFVDVKGAATLKLIPNWHKRTARPEGIDELFKKYPTGTGNF